MSEPPLASPLPTITPTNNGIIVGADPARAANGQFLPAPPAAVAPQPMYTAEDLANARKQEKDKLYSRIEEMNTHLQTLQKEREERLAAEDSLRKQAETESEEKRKAELTLKERVAQMEKEMEERFRTVEAERERERALLDKERSFLALSEYRQRRLNEERENILPELIDLIGGNTEEEIEQSIAGLRDRSDRILEGARQALGPVGVNPGARVTSPPAGPLDNSSENRLPTPDEIRNMDINEYQRHRERLLGSASSQRSRGLFG